MKLFNFLDKRFSNMKTVPLYLKIIVVVVLIVSSYGMFVNLGTAVFIVSAIVFVMCVIITQTLIRIDRGNKIVVKSVRKKQAKTQAKQTKKTK